MTITTSLAALKDPMSRAVEDAVESLASAHHFSAYDLARSLEDTWNLSRGEDCCYDRPSVGLNYAMWYHARRVQDLLRMCVPVWLTDGVPPAILDLGCGTGTVLWALAAAGTAGLDVRDTEVVCVDSSPPMLAAAKHMWQTLQADVCFGEAARSLTVSFRCRSWTQPDVDLAGAQVIASYLFDESDVTRLDEVVAAFHRVADRVSARSLFVLSSAKKEPILGGISIALDQHGWRVAQAERLPILWSGPSQRLASFRARVLADVPTDLPWQGRSPSFDHAERPAYHFATRTAPQEETGVRGTFVLDDAQQIAAVPERKLTVVVGPAGSGKSRVLIERLVRLAEDRDDRVRILLTTFNIDLLSQLRTWLVERLDHSTSGFRQRKGADGDYSFRSDADLTKAGEIRLLNWDKVPTRLMNVASISTSPSALNSPSLFQDRIAGHLARTGMHLREAEEGRLTAEFLKAEHARVIWGLQTATRAEYLQRDRKGRRHGLDRARMRPLGWDVLMGQGAPELFSHVRSRAMEASLDDADVFDALFIDECQDFTPADFRLAGRLVRDADGISAFGDETQSMHLGTSYRRPGLLEGHNGQARRWRTHTLHGSYRLPLRICEAVAPLAKHVEASHSALHDVDGEPMDLTDLSAVTSAVPGARPITLSGTRAEIKQQMAEVLTAYAPLLLETTPQNRAITIAEGHRHEWLNTKLLKKEVLPPALKDAEVRVDDRSMRAIKGLERPAVIWSTKAHLPADESHLEWIYTMLTRTTGLLLILLSDSAGEESREALRLLDPSRLLHWTARAQQHFHQLTDS